MKEMKYNDIGETCYQAIPPPTREQASVKKWEMSISFLNGFYPDLFSFLLVWFVVRYMYGLIRAVVLRVNEGQ